MKRTGKWMVLAVAVVLLLTLVCVPVMAAEPAAEGAVEETAANDGGISGKAMAFAVISTAILAVSLILIFS